MRQEGPAKLEIQIKSDWLFICLTFVAKSPGSRSLRMDNTTERGSWLNSELFTVILHSPNFAVSYCLKPKITR